MASSAIAPAHRNEIFVGNPTYRTIHSSDWYNKRVSWDPIQRGFVVNLDEVPADVTSLDVRVKTGLDPTGQDRYENEQWETVTIDLNQCAAFRPTVLKREWANAAAALDVSPWLCTSLCQKYQAALALYGSHFSQSQAIVRTALSRSQAAQPASPFAAFYKADMPAPDAHFRINANDSDDTKESDLAPPTGEPDDADEPAGSAVLVPVHQFVLVSASDGFKPLLASSTTINVHGVAIQTLEKFVHYLYALKIEIDSDKEASDLHILALRFKIDHLKDLTQPRAIKHLMARYHPSTMVTAAQLKEQMDACDSISAIGQAYQTAADRLSQGYATIQTNQG